MHTNTLSKQMATFCRTGQNHLTLHFTAHCLVPDHSPVCPDPDAVRWKPLAAAKRNPFCCRKNRPNTEKDKEASMLNRESL